MLTPKQQQAYDLLDDTPRCAYGLGRPAAIRVSLATLRALVRKGYARDVTPFGPGGMYSPTTHFKFVRVNKP